MATDKNWFESGQGLNSVDNNGILLQYKKEIQ